MRKEAERAGLPYKRDGLLSTLLNLANLTKPAPSQFCEYVNINNVFN